MKIFLSFIFLSACGDLNIDAQKNKVSPTPTPTAIAARIVKTSECVEPTISETPARTKILEWKFTFQSKEWKDAIREGGAIYRLPTRAEIVEAFDGNALTDFETTAYVWTSTELKSDTSQVHVFRLSDGWDIPYSKEMEFPILYVREE